MRFIGIDPSTKTGVVELDWNGNVIQATELVVPASEGDGLPGELDRINRIVETINRAIDQNDSSEGIQIAVETFSLQSTGKFVAQMYGIGWMLRNSLGEYLDVTPAQLKQFASGKGNASKDSLILDIYKRWGYEHKSDNVRDAYVLAQIARAMHNPTGLNKVQQTVIESLKNPKVKEKKTSRKKAGA